LVTDALLPIWRVYQRRRLGSALAALPSAPGGIALPPKETEALATELQTACTNHVVCNFERRLWTWAQVQVRERLPWIDASRASTRDKVVKAAIRVLLKEQEDVVFDDLLTQEQAELATRAIRDISARFWLVAKVDPEAAASERLQEGTRFSPWRDDEWLRTHVRAAFVVLIMFQDDQDR
jgi:hypothetical protein